MSFDSTIGEIEAQQKDLPKYAEYLNSLSLDPIEPAEAILVGAGDSLACAQFVERWKRFQSRSFDPYELSQNPEVAREKKVYFISASGRTKSNIEAAESVRMFASETTAITANPVSPLSKVCSSTLPLKFTKLSGVTPGTNSFTSSLLACARLFGPVPSLINLRELERQAKLQAESHSENAETAYFLASGFLYPIAFYGATKLREIAGERGEYQLTEEFSHMDLLSLKKTDLILLLQSEEDSRTAQLAKELYNGGYCAELLKLADGLKDPVITAIIFSIYFQYFALSSAIRKGLNEPFFLKDSKLLNISSKMIYFD